MRPRSLLGGYIGMFSSVCSILNVRSFPAARSYLWIDPPHCPRFTQTAAAFFPLWTLAKDSTRGSPATRIAVASMYATARVGAMWKTSSPNDRPHEPSPPGPDLFHSFPSGKALRIETVPILQSKQASACHQLHAAGNERSSAQVQPAAAPFSSFFSFFRASSSPVV